MKPTNALALSALLATAAQACVRVLVDETQYNDGSKTRQIHIWDQDKSDVQDLSVRDSK